MDVWIRGSKVVCSLLHTNVSNIGHTIYMCKSNILVTESILLPNFPLRMHELGAKLHARVCVIERWKSDVNKLRTKWSRAAVIHDLLSSFWTGLDVPLFKLHFMVISLSGVGRFQQTLYLNYITKALQKTWIILALENCKITDVEGFSSLYNPSFLIPIFVQQKSFCMKPQTHCLDLLGFFLAIQLFAIKQEFGFYTVLHNLATQSLGDMSVLPLS